jgi:hypothetical protein
MARTQRPGKNFKVAGMNDTDHGQRNEAQNMQNQRNEWMESRMSRVRNRWRTCGAFVSPKSTTPLNHHVYCGSEAVQTEDLAILTRADQANH